MNDLADKQRLKSVDDRASSELAITLGMLAAIEENSTVSQRSLASGLGIALGLANSYLKRCVKKGWIKVQQAPANRYAYYLTPTGFSEKTRLTAEFLSASLGFFRNAREQSAEVCAQAEARRLTRLALVGAGELAEIMTLTALDSRIEIVGIIDSDKASGRFAGLHVVGNVAELGPIDGVVITDMKAPQKSYDAWAALLGNEKVFAARLLKIARGSPVGREGRS
jgi:DNA-binding MarR family transcriptional regulator